ncbi:hypothetical protein Y032_0048g1652 [Ancylostoma ceylanicum]|nr:hypothetical protein Y032_0048g1652 [Ancylostoma ceylanicum]
MDAAVNLTPGGKTMVKVRKFQNNQNQGSHSALLAKAVLMDTETEKNRYNKANDTDYNRWFSSIRRDTPEEKKDRPAPSSRNGYWYTYESVPAREATLADEQISELSQMQSSLAQYVRDGNVGVMVIPDPDENNTEEENKGERDRRKSQGESNPVEEGNTEAQAYTEPKSESENSSSGSVTIVQGSTRGSNGPVQMKINLSQDEIKRLGQQKGNVRTVVYSENGQNKQQGEAEKGGESKISPGASYFIREGNIGAHVYTEPVAEGGSGGSVRIVQGSSSGPTQSKINLSPDEMKLLMQQKGNVTIRGKTYFIKEGNMGAYVRTEPGGENSSGGSVRIVQSSTSTGSGPTQSKINLSPDEIKRLLQQKGNVTIQGKAYFIREGNIGAHVYTEPVAEGESGGSVRIVQGSASGPSQSEINLSPDEIKLIMQQKGNVTIRGKTYFIKEGNMGAYVYTEPTGEGKNPSTSSIRIVQAGTGGADGSEKQLSLDELKRLLQQQGYNLSADELKRLQGQKGSMKFIIQKKQVEGDKKEGEEGKPQGASYFVKEGNMGAYVYTEPVGEGVKSSGGSIRIVQSSAISGDGSKTEGASENPPSDRVTIMQGAGSGAGPAQPGKYLSVEEFKRLQPSGHKVEVIKLKDASGIKPCDKKGATSGAGDFWLLRTRPCNENSPEGRIILPNGEVLRFYGQPQLVNV